MSRTVSFSLLAGLLTLAAATSALWPRRTVAPPPVVGSGGDVVRLEVRPSHSLVSADGQELFAEVSVRVQTPLINCSQILGSLI